VQFDFFSSPLFLSTARNIYEAPNAFHVLQSFVLLFNILYFNWLNLSFVSLPACKQMREK